MYQFLFRNRWSAALWSAVTLASVAGFVAKGGGVDDVDKAVGDIRARQEKVAAMTPSRNDDRAYDDSEEEEETSSDDASADTAAPMDDGLGFDPTPADFAPDVSAEPDMPVDEPEDTGQIGNS